MTKERTSILGIAVGLAVLACALLWTFWSPSPVANGEPVGDSNTETPVVAEVPLVARHEVGTEVDTAEPAGEPSGEEAEPVPHVRVQLGAGAVAAIGGYRFSVATEPVQFEAPAAGEAVSFPSTPWDGHGCISVPVPFDGDVRVQVYATQVDGTVRQSSAAVVLVAPVDGKLATLVFNPALPVTFGGLELTASFAYPVDVKLKFSVEGPLLASGNRRFLFSKQFEGGSNADASVSLEGLPYGEYQVHASSPFGTAIKDNIGRFLVGRFDYHGQATERVDSEQEFGRVTFQLDPTDHEKGLEVTVWKGVKSVAKRFPEDASLLLPVGSQFMVRAREHKGDDWIRDVPFTVTAADQTIHLGPWVKRQTFELNIGPLFEAGELSYQGLVTVKHEDSGCVQYHTIIDNGRPVYAWVSDGVYTVTVLNPPTVLRTRTVVVPGFANPISFR